MTSKLRVNFHFLLNDLRRFASIRFGCLATLLLGVTGTTLGERGELTGYNCLLFPTDLGVIGDGVGITDPSEGV